MRDPGVLNALCSGIGKQLLVFRMIRNLIIPFEENLASSFDGLVSCYPDILWKQWAALGYRIFTIGFFSSGCISTSKKLHHVTYEYGGGGV
jgi:hypothetical protein